MSVPVRSQGYVFGNYEVAQMSKDICLQMIGSVPASFAQTPEEFAAAAVRIVRAIIAEVERTQPPRE